MEFLIKLSSDKHVKKKIVDWLLFYQQRKRKDILFLLGKLYRIDNVGNNVSEVGKD